MGSFMFFAGILLYIVWGIAARNEYSDVKVKPNTTGALPKGESPSNFAGLMTGELLINYSIPNAQTCDRILFMNSMGKLCDKNQCEDTSLYIFLLTLGSTICVSDVNGEVMKIYLSESYIKSRYQLLYYTSNFIVKTSYYNLCKGSGTCRNGGCTVNTKSQDFADRLIQTVEGYGCQTDNLGCDICFHQTGCVYYRWWIEAIGEKYSVYKKVSETWEIKINTEYKELKQNYVLDVNNPSLKLFEDSEFFQNEVQLYIISFYSEIPYRQSSIININGSYWYLQAADINFPIAGSIGEYQISVNGREEIFDTDQITCQVNYCKANCSATKSAINRLSEHKPPQKDIFQRIQRESIEVEAKIPVKANALMEIGNVQINSLPTTLGHCEIEMVMTFGCDRCTVLPYIIFRAYNIKSPGIIPIQSNCSFDRPYVSCNYDLYTLTLRSREQSCMITIPSLNITKMADFNYIDYGRLYG